MAKLTTRARLGFTATFTVDEEELRALDALSGYGVDAFIKGFYEKLGSVYMRDHEAGLRRFLEEIRGVAGKHLTAIDRGRAMVDGCGKVFITNYNTREQAVCVAPQSRCDQCNRLCGIELVPRKVKETSDG